MNNPAKPSDPKSNLDQQKKLKQDKDSQSPESRELNDEGNADRADAAKAWEEGNSLIDIRVPEMAELARESFILSWMTAMAQARQQQRTLDELRLKAARLAILAMDLVRESKNHCGLSAALSEFDAAIARIGAPEDLEPPTANVP